MLLNKIKFQFSQGLTILAISAVTQSLKIGDLCPNQKSVCALFRECPSAIQNAYRGVYPQLCSFDQGVPVVCCPEAYSQRNERLQDDSNDKVIFPGNSKSLTSKNCDKYRSQVCYKKINTLNNGIPPALVVNGEEAKPKQFPHMALVGFGSNYYNVNWKCGGSLISEYFVLSAAHCANSEIDGSARWVRLGELDLESNTEDAKPEDFSIIQHFVHPEYNPPMYYNDIALFKLNRAVKFNNYIRPICLHDTDRILNKYLIASGWGALGYGEITNNKLMHVSLGVISQDVCSRLYPKDKELPRSVDGKSQICAGYLEGGKDTCQGDSGGPLQYLTVKENCQLLYTQVGITSFGRGCASKNSPGIYTRVSYFIPWIESIVWK